MHFICGPTEARDSLFTRVECIFAVSTTLLSFWLDWLGSSYFAFDHYRDLAWTEESSSALVVRTDEGLSSSSEDAPDKEEKDDEYSAILSRHVRAVVK